LSLQAGVWHVLSLQSGVWHVVLSLQAGVFPSCLYGEASWWPSVGADCCLSSLGSCSRCACMH